MHQLRRRILPNLIRLADLAVMTAAFGVALVIAGQSFGAGGLSEFFTVRIKLVNLLFFIGWLVTWHLTLKSFGLYKSRRAAVTASEWWTISKAVTICTLLLSFLAMRLARQPAVGENTVGIALAGQNFAGVMENLAIFGPIVHGVMARLIGPILKAKDGFF